MAADAARHLGLSCVALPGQPAALAGEDHAARAGALLRARDCAALASGLSDLRLVPEAHEVGLHIDISEDPRRADRHFDDAIGVACDELLRSGIPGKRLDPVAIVRTP